MRFCCFLLLMASAGHTWAQACLVHSQAERLDVRVCQQNRSIPEKLFREGFCKPELPGQKTEVQTFEQCPQGAFGVCENARVDNLPYRQDIHYYGITSDARYLKPFCEQKSQGVWRTP